MNRLDIKGEKYILLAETEYKRLKALADMPAYPKAFADGTLPALEASRVALARTIIRQRAAKGWSQRNLAVIAGVTVQTLNRIEKAKVTPDMATVNKIDRALKMSRK